MNGASFAPAGGRRSGIAPGSIVSIFGENLGRETAAAEQLPLPTTLRGTTVTFNDFVAPLFFVSPGQLNVQVPSGFFFPRLKHVEVRVMTSFSVSESVGAELNSGDAGIFTLDQSGCGQGAVLNVAADGSVSSHGPANSVEPGGIVTIFATGLGVGDRLPPDGFPVPPDPLFPVSAGAGLDDLPAGVRVLFAGKAPGFVGLDQLNLQIGEDAPEGCAVPLSVGTATSRSQSVPLSIRRGGGQCEDPPDQTFGLVKWERKVTTSLDSETETQTFTAGFSGSPFQRLPELVPTFVVGNDRLPIEPGSCVINNYRVKGPSCPGFTRLLNAGELTLDAPGLGETRLQPVESADGPLYSLDLPPGALRAGSHHVLAEGESELAGFETAVPISDPIEITTDLSPGSVIDVGKNLSVSWTGAEPKGFVTMQVISRWPNNLTYGSTCLATAEQGQVTLTLIEGGLPLVYGEVEIIIRHFSNKELLDEFEADGLTLGGRHMWSYEFVFRDLLTSDASNLL